MDLNTYEYTLPNVEYGKYELTIITNIALRMLISIHRISECVCVCVVVVHVPTVVLTNCKPFATIVVYITTLRLHNLCNWLQFAPFALQQNNTETNNNNNNMESK